MRRLHVADALKTHRRDQLIEWIKGLLAVPFVLLSQPTAVSGDDKSSVDAMALNAHKRYSEISKQTDGHDPTHVIDIC
jgi:IMP and pyridine-specific 5'-nucleotidase